jgi:hypothetical protein
VSTQRTTGHHGIGAIYDATVAHRIAEARVELVDAPLAIAAAGAAAGRLAACAALGEIAARRRLNPAQRDRWTRELTALADCAAGHLALADLAAARHADARRTSDAIARAFEEGRRDG